MKTKLFRNLGILLGSFAIALGVGINIVKNHKIEDVNATPTTYTMTIDSSSNGTNNVHWISTSTTSLTYSGKTWSTSVSGTSSITASTTQCQIGSKKNPATSVSLSTTGFGGKKIVSASIDAFCLSNTGPTITITAGNTIMLNSDALQKTESKTHSSTVNNVTIGTNDTVSFVFNSSANAAIVISSLSITYDDVGDPVTVSSVKIDGSETSSETIDNARVNNTKQLTSTVEYEGEEGTSAVSWASSSSSVATVSNNGLVTFLSNGTTDITATSNEDTTKVATYSLTLTNILPEHGKDLSDPLSVDEVVDLIDSGSYSGDYYVIGYIYNDPEYKSYTSSYNINIVDDLEEEDPVIFQFYKLLKSDGSFDGSENFQRCGQMVAHGSLQLYGSIYEFSSCTLDSYTAPTIIEATGISFNPTSITLNCGETSSFTPTLTGGSGPFETEISWVSSDISVVASPSNSEDGAVVEFSALTVTTQTIVTLTGTVVSPGSASASIQITVNPIADSVIANESNYNVLEGGTLDLSTCVTTTGASTLSFSTESSYVSIDGNTLTTGENPNTVSEITATKGAASCTFNVTIIENTGWTKVTSASQLEVGKTYTISNAAGTKTMSNTQETNNRKSIATSVVAGKLQDIDGIAKFVLCNSSNNNYALYDEEKSALLSSASSSSNYMKTDGSYDTAKAFCSITINSDENNSVSIVFQGTFSRNTIKYNSSSDLFSCYSGGQNPIVLWKSNSAAKTYGETWAQDFNDNLELVCDPTGSTSLDENDWTDIKDEWTNGEYNDAERLQVLYSNPENESKLKKALEGYDFIVAKYGYNDFLGRETINSTNKITPITSLKGGSLIIIVISIAGLTAIGGYFFYKKRKEN